MATQITLGNITTQNGRTTIGGSQSGLDTEALIKGLTEAKRLPAVRLETKNEQLATQKTALSSLQSLLTRFRTAMDSLRNPPGVLNASQNIFEYRTASFSSVVTSSNYLGVTVQPGANPQSFSIDEIEQVARETRQESSNFVLADANTSVVAASGAATAGQFSAGTVTLRNLSGGAGVDITLNEGDSLNAVAAKFNAVKDRTGIQATVLKVANGDPNSTYKIIFTGTQTGLTGEFDLADSATVLADADDVFAQVGFTTKQTAQNAKFTLNGVEIERENNTVTDLIDGITFTIKQPLSSATPIGVNIEPDLEIVTNAINQMADIYNELRVFQAKQNELGEDGLPTEDAVLANDPTLRSISTAVTSFMTSLVNGLSDGSPASLSEIGIGFQDFEGDEETPRVRNIIVINAEKLQSSLSANFDAVRDVFEFKFTSDSDKLALFKTSNSITASGFTLNLDRTNNVYTATVDGNTVQLDYTPGANGVITLKGKAGTPLAGLEMIYASTDDATINVSLSQGVADKVYNELNSALSAGGALTNALQAIQDQTSRNQTEIGKVDEFIERYREQLINQYSALEAALTKANQLLNLLDQQAQARNNA